MLGTMDVLNFYERQSGEIICFIFERLLMILRAVFLEDTRCAGVRVG